MTTRISRKLKVARLRLQLTVRDVERLSKKRITNACVSQVENGKFTPNPATLRELARIYRLNYLRLLIDAGHLTELELIRDARRAVNGRSFT